MIARTSSRAASGIRFAAFAGAMALAAFFTSIGSGPAQAQTTDALNASTTRAADFLSRIHKQLRSYDRTTQMRVARGALSRPQAAERLMRRAEELARGAVSPAAQAVEERQEAATYFAEIEKAATDSTRWPPGETAAYYRAFVKSMLTIARDDYDAAIASGRDAETALSTSYRALALTRGQKVASDATTPFSDPDRRIYGALELPADPPGVASQPQSAAPAAASPKPSQPRQALGCFKDYPLDLNGLLEHSNQNTPERCVQLCASKQFRFAGVQNGESCLCGNGYGKLGPATNCNIACTGNRGEICGGVNANNVYPTGL